MRGTTGLERAARGKPTCIAATCRTAAPAWQTQATCRTTARARRGACRPMDEGRPAANRRPTPMQEPANARTSDARCTGLVVAVDHWNQTGHSTRVTPVLRIAALLPREVAAAPRWTSAARVARWSPHAMCIAQRRAPPAWCPQRAAKEIPRLEPVALPAAEAWEPLAEEARGAPEETAATPPAQSLSSERLALRPSRRMGTHAPAASPICVAATLSTAWQTTTAAA